MELLNEIVGTASPSGFEKGVQDIVVRECLAHKHKPRIDAVGNVWAKIGDKPRTIFTAHMDCVHNHYPVIFEVDEKGIMSLSKESHQTALGADDSVGVSILLHMMEHEVEGIYLFTIKEEVGCIGASHAAKNCPDYVDQAICFDRKDTESVITRMSGGDCCSDAFATDLIRELGKTGLTFKKDPSGSTTDTNKFAGCTLNHTNISAGYYDEHSERETLDTNFFLALKSAVLEVDWNSLSSEKRPAYTPPTLFKSWGAGVRANKQDLLDIIYDDSIPLLESIEDFLSGLDSIQYLPHKDWVEVIESIGQRLSLDEGEGEAQTYG